jgi:hypothetical protein
VSTRQFLLRTIVTGASLAALGTFGILVEAAGRDFAAAVATAIRDEERQGTVVRRVERA